MLIDEMSVTEIWTPAYLRMRSGDRLAWSPAERNLGSLVTAVSLCLYELAQKPGRPPETHASIPLDEVTLERLSEVAWPLQYRVVLRSGPYRYEATCDAEVEHVLLLWEGAMRFFAHKYKLVTVEAEVCRNRERAAQEGFLTREDG